MQIDLEDLGVLIGEVDHAWVGSGIRPLGFHGVVEELGAFANYGLVDCELDAITADADGDRIEQAGRH
jgi:hypothetical protein